MELRRIWFALVLLVLSSSHVFAGDIVHQDDVAPKKPGCENNFVLVDQWVANEKVIDKWLPVTSSRNAKWYYSTFHNVSAMVGAGILSLPYAMSEFGWGPGVAILVIFWIATLYTLWQMVEMHEMVPGRRFDRYHELGQYAFGEKLGLYIVVPQQQPTWSQCCLRNGIAYVNFLGKGWGFCSCKSGFEIVVGFISEL